MKNPEQHDVHGAQTIREKIKDKGSADFSSATRRRLALFLQNRDTNS